MVQRINRRRFVQTGSALFAAASFGSFPKRTIAFSLEKLRTAHIGVGGMGASDLASISSHPDVEVAAICDVDAELLEKAHALHANAATFRDFREMISTLGSSIDAVVVSTPDHTHAPAAMTAMLAGKPVYCQKPLTHEVFESRQLRQVAAEKKLVTQMGVQIHSLAVYKRAVQIIRDGVIGKISQVHAWSNKNWGYDGGQPEPVQPPPEILDWDLWLGTAPKRSFVPNVYHPGNWRRFVDFGTGTLGDMGVHIFDTPYTALELTAPRWVKTSCRPPTGIGHPEKNTVEYEFPGTRFTTDKMLWKWYDGAFAPPAVADVGLPDGTELPGQGSLFIGETGQMLLPHIDEAVLFPLEKFKDYVRPEMADEDHYHQWVNACLGHGETSMGFERAGPLTESLLLGVVANRFPDQRLDWDSGQLKITNHESANSLLRRDYREGFEVDRIGKAGLVPAG
jgi:predicted dehydrogenase